MNQDQPIIIIKKIKKISGGHHGGAWKVAYADFVTAMMAFFLLMWLLSSTSKEQREGIANYFNAITFSNKTAVGKNISSDNQEESDNNQYYRDKNVSNAKLLEGQIPTSGTAIKSLNQDFNNLIKEEQNNNNLDNVEQALKKSLDEKGKSKVVEFDKTQDTLTIRILDLPQEPMFVRGKSTLTPKAKEILAKVAKQLKKYPHQMFISGHTDAQGFNLATKLKAYDNWNLSFDRAKNAAILLVDRGVQSTLIQAIESKTDRDTLDGLDIFHPKNRRIEIRLLKQA